MNKKIVLVTGANRGIGLGIVERFIQEKEYLVIATARKNCDLLMLESIGAIAEELDVYSDESISNLFLRLKEKKNMPDVMINNAGIAKVSPFVKLSIDEWNNVINTNLSSVFKMSQGVIRHMAKKKFGRIINISSVLAGMPQIGLSHYCASKAGIEALTRCISLEYASKGVTANCIAPGFVRTDILQCLGKNGEDMMNSKIPIGQISEPKDVAELAVFLAKDSSRHITGETINMNAGLYFR